MSNWTLGGLGAHFIAVAKALPAAERAGIEAACQIVEKASKGMIGHGNAGWPPLAPSTVERKGANTPLLETGELRESIQHTVISSQLGMVGSDSEKAVYHELGTSHIPPRSFLRLAAIKKAAAVERVIARAVLSLLSAQNAAVGEAWNLFKHGMHNFKELGKSLVDEEEGERRRD
jgi:hypothetical protein